MLQMDMPNVLRDRPWGLNSRRRCEFCADGTGTPGPKGGVPAGAYGFQAFAARDRIPSYALTSVFSPSRNSTSTLRPRRFWTLPRPNLGWSIHIPSSQRRPTE